VMAARPSGASPATSPPNVSIILPRFLRAKDGIVHYKVANGLAVFLLLRRKLLHDGPLSIV